VYVVVVVVVTGKEVEGEYSVQATYQNTQHTCRNRGTVHKPNTHQTSVGDVVPLA